MGKTYSLCSYRGHGPGVPVKLSVTKHGNLNIQRGADKTPFTVCLNGNPEGAEIATELLLHSPALDVVDLLESDDQFVALARMVVERRRTRNLKRLTGD